MGLSSGPPSRMRDPVAERLQRFRARHLAVLTNNQDGQSYPLTQASRNLAWQIRCVSA